MTHIGQQVLYTLPGPDGEPVPTLGFVTAVDDKRKDKDDQAATFVDLVVFPAREAGRAIDGVRLYDTAGDCDQARENGLGHAAHTEVDDGGAKSRTGRTSSKAKTGDPKTPADAGDGSAPVVVP